jgi:hypothetical protein
MADQQLRAGRLRERFDVIIFPHVGGTSTQQVHGIPKTDTIPLPYRKTDRTPNLGANDASDDIRGGMGLEGLAALEAFVREGGTLIVEGSTSTIFPDFGLVSGVTVETPDSLFVRGSILRGVLADKRSPITYGYAGSQLPVYFSQAPVLNARGGAGGGVGGRASPPGVGMDITPMASPPRLSAWEEAAPRGAASRTAPAGAAADAATGPRVVLEFPAREQEMLLSGSLAHGAPLSRRAQVVDAPLGDGHVVMFAIRPFWRWQTQGTYFLGFNAILHWNDLDAGRAAPRGSRAGTTPTR